MSLQFTTPTSLGQGLVSQSTSKGWAKLPHDLIEDRRLKPLDVKLAGILLRYARAKTVCWPSVARLAHDLDRGERTTQYSLKRLVKAGWFAYRADTTIPENRTGRFIVLVWREMNCTPKVQLSIKPSVQIIAPECKKEERKEDAPIDRQEGESAGPGKEGDKLITAMDEDERKAFFAGLNLIGVNIGRLSTHNAATGLTAPSLGSTWAGSRRPN